MKKPRLRFYLKLETEAAYNAAVAELEKLFGDKRDFPEAGPLTVAIEGTLEYVSDLDATKNSLGQFARRYGGNVIGIFDVRRDEWICPIEEAA